MYLYILHVDMWDPKRQVGGVEKTGMHDKDKNIILNEKHY